MYLKEIINVKIIYKVFILLLISFILTELTIDILNIFS